MRLIPANALTCFILGVICGMSCFINTPAICIEWIPITAIIAIASGVGGGLLASVVDWERRFKNLPPIPHPLEHIIDLHLRRAPNEGRRQDQRQEDT